MSTPDPGLPAPLDRPLETFSTRAVEVLREMVVAGRLRSGERLNEVALAGALGISRGPLREAIARLTSEGLLTSVTNRGSYVRVFTDEQLRELYEVRIALETHALRLAAADAGQPAIRGLRKLLDRTGRSMAAGRVYPRDLDFHLGLVTVTGNRALIDAALEVHRQIDLARSRSARVTARARQALAEHEEVYDHLLHGRADAAAAALTAHLHSSLDNALHLLHDDGPRVGGRVGSRAMADRQRD